MSSDSRIYYQANQLRIPSKAFCCETAQGPCHHCSHLWGGTWQWPSRTSPLSPTTSAQPHQAFLCWAAVSSLKAFRHQRLAGVREQVEISIILFSVKIAATLPNPTPTKSETWRNSLQGMMHNTCHNVWIPRLSTLVTWVECSKIYSKSELSEWGQPCRPGCYLLAEMVQAQATWHAAQYNKKL